MAHDVFLSYSSQDKTTADAVCAGLEAEGIRCWIAPRDIPPGSNYGAEINSALKNCAVFVLIFSKPAGDSVWVMKEVERAISYRKPVVPFRIDETTPGEGLEFYLASCHWLDALSSPLSKHIAVLARSVLAFVPPDRAAEAAERKKKLGYGAEAPPAPVPEPAPEPPPDPVPKPAPAPVPPNPLPVPPQVRVSGLPIIPSVLAVVYASFFTGWSVSMLILQVLFNWSMDDQVHLHFAIAAAWMAGAGFIAFLLLKHWNKLEFNGATYRCRALVCGFQATVPAFVASFLMVPVLFGRSNELHMVLGFEGVLWPLVGLSFWGAMMSVGRWHTERYTPEQARRRAHWLGWGCGLAIIPGLASAFIFGRMSMPDQQSFLLATIAFLVAWGSLMWISRFLFVRAAR